MRDKPPLTAAGGAVDGGARVVVDSLLVYRRHLEVVARGCAQPAHDGALPVAARRLDALLVPRLGAVGRLVVDVVADDGPVALVAVPPPGVPL